jgi:hypothetical protein
MYVTTEDQGRWYSSNRRAAAPVFTQLGGYPFRFPTRVFFNPYDTNEVWVTSFGNGMRLGRGERTEAAPAHYSADQHGLIGHRRRPRRTKGRAFGLARSAGLDADRDERYVHQPVQPG